MPLQKTLIIIILTIFIGFLVPLDNNTVIKPALNAPNYQINGDYSESGLIHNPEDNIAKKEEWFILVYNSKPMTNVPILNLDECINYSKTDYAVKNKLKILCVESVSGDMYDSKFGMRLRKGWPDKTNQ